MRGALESGAYPQTVGRSIESLAQAVEPVQGTSYTLPEDRDAKLEELAKAVASAGISTGDPIARSIVEMRDALAAYDKAGIRTERRYSRSVIRTAPQTKSDRRPAEKLTAPSWIFRSPRCISDFRRGYETGCIRLSVRLGYDELIAKRPRPKMLQGHCDQARRAYMTRSSAFCYGVAAAMYIKAEQKAAA